MGEIYKGSKTNNWQKVCYFIKKGDVIPPSVYLQLDAHLIFVVFLPADYQ